MSTKNEEVTSEDVVSPRPPVVMEGAVMSNRTAGFYLLLIFLSSVASLGLVFYNFPKLTDEERSMFRYPTNIEAAKDVGRVLSRYKESHYYSVLTGLVVVYIFLQSFAIPGSISLSVLSGFLFPFWLALFLVCLCSSVGATFCYLLSSMVGHGLVNRWFPERLKSWKSQVVRHKSDLINYIIFLRITPIIPNWFINIASPIIGVSIPPFFIGTFIGVAPPSFLFIRAGTTLYELTTSTGYISVTSVLVLGALAVLSLLPVFLKRWLKSKLE